MKRIIPLVAMWLIGCSAVEQTADTIEPPVVVRTVPLPSIGAHFPLGGLKLDVMVHVLRDGTVGDAGLNRSSGIPEWDSLLIQSIRQWRFTAARRNGVPVDLWIRQPVAVQIQEPVMRILGELVAATPGEADSLYALLLGGAEFDSLLRHARGASPTAIGGLLGEVNIASYAPQVRSELQRLREDEVTHPLRVGDRYIIFKRFRKDLSRNLPG